MAGAAMTAVGLAGCAVLAFVRPQPTLGAAPILAGRPSGALYVRVGDTLHPVLNLASARLITGAPADARPARDSDIGRARRGPLLGIPGAPQTIGAAMPDAVTWSVCDTTGSDTATVVVAGDGGSAQLGVLAPDQPVPVRAAAGSGDAGTYLLHHGRRSVADAPVPLAREVSALLVNAVPETPDPPPTVASPDPAAVLNENAPTLCVTWRPRPTGAEVDLLAGRGLPLPDGERPVTLAQADGAGSALDGIYLPPGHTGYLRPIGVSGPDGGARYLVTDTGVRFTVADDDAARSLGLPDDPIPVPWPVLAGLPVGPLLARDAALVARDVVESRARG